MTVANFICGRSGDMARWKHMALAGIVAAGVSLLAGVRVEAALQTDGSYAPGQAHASVKPKIVGGDPVIYLDGGDQISVEGENVCSVSYTSDDAKVAKIDSGGSIVPLSVGDTKIRAEVTCMAGGEMATETLTYDLQVFPKSTEYFKYHDLGWKKQIKGLTAKGKQLREVYIPDYCEGKEVLEVHVDAFLNDTALQKVYVSDNLVYLDYQIWDDEYWPGKSFSGCTNLKELHLGKSLKGLGHGFASSLEKITVDERNETFQVRDNVLFAGEDRLVCYPGARPDAFYQIPEGVRTVDEDAFFGAANLKKVGFPSGIEDISGAFCYAGLVEAAIPRSMESCSRAFMNCVDLKEASIEAENVKDVYHVFEGCGNLKTIHVRKAVPGAILAGCKSVEEIRLTPDAEGVSVKDGVLFSGDGKELLVYPSGKAKEYTLPAGTERIADGALTEACASKVILNRGLKEIGESAFYKSKITEMTLPDSVCKLGRRAFEECRSLGSVKLSKNLEEVFDFTFDGCVSLKKLHIPRKLKEVGVSRGCRKLTTFTVGKGNPSYIAQKGVLYSKSGNILYAYPPGKKGEKYAVPGTVEKIWDSAFAGNRYLQEIIMGNQVTYCGDSAFSGAASLEKITLSKELSVLGACAFSGCKKLQSVMVPDKVERIELATFRGCTAIKQITLGRKVKFVNTWNFDGCKNLQRLTCRSLIEDWYGGSFEQAGSKNYGKLVVSFPGCRSKKKRLAVKDRLRWAGLNRKSKVVFEDS